MQGSNLPLLSLMSSVGPSVQSLAVCQPWQSQSATQPDGGIVHKHNLKCRPSVALRDSIIPAPQAPNSVQHGAGGSSNHRKLFAELLPHKVRRTLRLRL